MKRWLSRYLSLLTLIPVIVLIVFISFDVMRAYNALDQANKTILDANLVNVTSQLTHELQKERGMSAGYIGSNGAEFKSEIRPQRTATDKEIQNLTNFLDNSDYDLKTEQTLKQLINRLQNIQNIRQKVDSLTIGLGEALAYYSGSNQLLLDLNGYLATQLEESTSAQKFLTLYNIAYAKEQAGIERAVLSNIFASDSVTPALLTSYIELTTKQNTYVKSSYVTATPDFKMLLDEFVQSTESRDVERFRDTLKFTQNGFNIDAAEWFAAATARINKLKVTEEKLLNEMRQYAQEKVETRFIVIVLESILLVLMLVLAYGVFSTIQLRAAQSHEINRFMKTVDTEKDLTDSIEVLTEDELGRIATLINVTFTNIRTDFTNFQKNAHEIAEATIQAASATEQSKDNLIQLQMDISSIASATEEMSGSIKSVMENMLVASDGAQRAAKETINGEKAVETSMLGISHTADEVARVGETITELNSRVNDILSMVDVIKSVAEQTNLLALNAAIEAARAGEQGRGFAVVADEVRSLAQRTQQSTQEISEVVDVLKISSQNAFSSIESGNQQAKEAVVNAQQISEVLAKIVNNIRSVDDVTRVVASSTKEQSTVIQSINTNVGSIDEQARENVVGAEQLSASSSKLLQIARDMEDRIKVYKF
ncbi:methyl-accepting chemotaxis protein [Brumicola nitratireducens]|uniref:Methyl-accepting chemotaxis protein n=1 Tax=Glaciecola nitratireducens (strain JCM 12485 / KCTC 12276 / FR1064) TaxID=1085623 RepID=G4QMV2_GLANF|nr:methyl-accepting chemotaxis protein [Glaciecola nitratireducens]AEP31035.1 methyl-accepting chemotaxis protein [Glaciecola nitratireducens FR1064]